MSLIVKSGKTQVNIHNEMYLNTICQEMTIRKFCSTSLITGPYICSQNCSVKVGDIVILCLLEVIPTFFKLQYFENRFSEVNKTSPT